MKCEPTFFGTNGERPGHYCWEPNQSYATGNLKEVYAISEAVGKSIDGSFCDRSKPEYHPTLTHINGWTCVGWPDFSGDKRRSVNAGLFAKGEWSTAEMIEAGRKRYPWAEERFRKVILRLAFSNEKVQEVKLTYFKPSGKYYSEGSFDVPASLDLLAIRDLARKFIAEDAPGLRGNWAWGITLVTAPGHEHDYPMLVMPTTTR